MSNNQFIKSENRERDKIYEILIVLMVIACVIYIGVKYYEKPIGQSQKSIIEFHAGIFSRMISNLHAVGKSSKNNGIKLNDVVFYLNESGWPANTDRRKSPSLRNQTAEECREIWNAVFANAPSSDIDENRYKKNIDYVISLKKNVICRYELVRKQEGSYFFDYDVSNGAVNVFRPES